MVHSLEKAAVAAVVGASVVFGFGRAAVQSPARGQESSPDDPVPGAVFKAQVNEHGPNGAGEAPDTARPDQPTSKAAGGEYLVLAFDGFDGKLGLNWRPVRPDPSHVSLTRKPGTLTITTQRGSIYGEETKDAFGAGIQAKNLYLIDNPLGPGGDFEVTTCVSGFTPVMLYQQAGLIIYNNDDDYLKFGYESNWPVQGAQAFCIVTETGARPQMGHVSADLSGLEKFWVRLTKHGTRYTYSTSTDGGRFVAHGEVEWGDGAPRRVGVLAKNGGNKDATELDAHFEFFKFRSLHSGHPHTDE